MKLLYLQEMTWELDYFKIIMEGRSCWKKYACYKLTM